MCLLVNAHLQNYFSQKLFDKLPSSEIPENFQHNNLELYSQFQVQAAMNWLFSFTSKTTLLTLFTTGNLSLTTVCREILRSGWHWQMLIGNSIIFQISVVLSPLKSTQFETEIPLKLRRAKMLPTNFAIPTAIKRNAILATSYKPLDTDFLISRKCMELVFIFSRRSLTACYFANCHVLQVNT